MGFVSGWAVDGMRDVERSMFQTHRRGRADSMPFTVARPGLFHDQRNRIAASRVQQFDAVAGHPTYTVNPGQGFALFDHVQLSVAGDDGGARSTVLILRDTHEFEYYGRRRPPIASSEQPRG